jgi:hypothetical protein
MKTKKQKIAKVKVKSFSIKLKKLPKSKNIIKDIKEAVSK